MFLASSIVRSTVTVPHGPSLSKQGGVTASPYNTSTVMGTAVVAGSTTVTASSTVEKAPYADADEKEAVACERSVGNNRGVRGHVGRDVSVKVTV